MPETARNVAHALVALRAKLWTAADDWQLDADPKELRHGS
jgi:hypothetical protein